MRTLRTALASAGLLAATAATAGVPDTFPVSYADHEFMKVVAVASFGVWTLPRVTRTTIDDTLVFDDASNLHFEYATAPPYPAAATWKAVAPRRLTFRYTEQTVEAARQWALDEIGMDMTVRLAVGRANLTFSRDGSTYRGTQRIVARARKGGIRVVATETVRYRGTRL